MLVYDDFNLVDYLEEENEVEPNNALNISSFMVKKTDDSNRYSYPTEEDIQSEPIYCKIQSKVLRVRVICIINLPNNFCYAKQL